MSYIGSPMQPPSSSIVIGFLVISLCLLSIIFHASHIGFDEFHSVPSRSNIILSYLSFIFILSTFQVYFKLSQFLFIHTVPDNPFYCVSSLRQLSSSAISPSSCCSLVISYTIIKQSFASLYSLS